MNIELHKFKKISENKKEAVLKHPLGHKITIAKNILSPELKKQVEGLTLHLASGTPDSPIEENDPEIIRKNALAKSEGQGEERANANNPDFQSEFPEAKPVQVAQAQPQQPNIVINNTPPPQQAPQPAPQAQVAQALPVQDQRFNPVNQPNQIQQSNVQADPYGANAYANISKEGLQNQIQGINETASAQNAQNQAVAQERDSGANAQQQQLNDATSRMNDLRAEHQSFVKDYQNGHIDPGHFLNSMGTGQKIATAIGLILGGMGGGLTHQGNPAMEFLQKQIDRDIEAQKSELGKKQNLLSANLQQFGNERDAASMTLAMQNSIVANKIEAAALKSGNPVLIARAKQAAGELESKNAGLFSQIAIRQSLGGGQNQNSQQARGPAPAEQIRMMGMSNIMPEADQKKAYEELGKKEETESLRSQLQDSFRDLNDKMLHGAFSPADRDSAIQAIAGKLAKVSEGRFNLEESKQQIDAFLPRRLEGSQTTQNKLVRLNNFIDGLTQTPVLDAYRIKLHGKEPSIDQKGNSKVAEGAPILTK